MRKVISEMADAIDLARMWIEVWDEGHPSTLPLSEDFVHVSPFGRIEGRDEYLRVVEPMSTEQVASLQIEDLMGDADRACVRFLMTTPGGQIPCCDWVTVANGLIVSVHSYYDSRDLPHFERYG